MMRVEQALVHIDIDHLRAVLDLLASDLDGGFIIIVEDQLLEARRARDIGALADIDEIGGRGCGHNIAMVSVDPGKSRETIIFAPSRLEPMVQAAMVKGSSPERRVRTVTVGILRGSWSATASAMARI